MKCQYCVWEHLSSETWSWQVWLWDNKWVNEALVFWRSSQDVLALPCLNNSVLCHTCFTQQLPALHQMAKVWHPELPYWAINSILFNEVWTEVSCWLCLVRFFLEIKDVLLFYFTILESNIVLGSQVLFPLPIWSALKHLIVTKPFYKVLSQNRFKCSFT